jgi:hypothetical protein
MRWVGKNIDPFNVVPNIPVMIPPKDILTGPVIPAGVRESKILVTALASGLLVLSQITSQAAALVTSLPIKFGSDVTNGAGDISEVNSAAGVLNTVQWNNLTFNNGSASDLTLDVNGNIVASSASVTWTSNNTWSSTGLGEENNIATGENRDLMAGYLDTLDVPNPGVSISVSGLPSAFTLFGYDVYVYIQGGVNGRGGTYTIGPTTAYHEATAAFDGTFIEDTNPDNGTAEVDGSNYLLFRDLTGNSFDLTSAPVLVRAPVNAIEIVAHVPEPSSLALIGGCGLLSLTRWRRRSD